MRGYGSIIIAGLCFLGMSSTAGAVQQSFIAHIAFSNGASLSKVGDLNLKVTPSKPLMPGHYRLSTSGMAFHQDGKTIAGNHLAGEIAIIGTDQQVVDIMATNYKEGKNITVEDARCRYAGGKETSCSLAMQPTSSKGLPLLLGADLNVGSNNNLPTQPAQFDIIVTYN